MNRTEEAPVFFIDVDSTLASHDTSSADRAVRDELLRLFPGKPEAGGMFGRLYSDINSFYLGIREEPGRKLAGIMNSYGVTTSQKLNAKQDFMFSRELYLKYISEQCALRLSGSQIMRIAGIYWKTIVESTKLFEDSTRFLQRTKNKFVIAGSDTRIKFAGGKMLYEPEYSSGLRLKRTKAIGLSKFFKDGEILIGDPCTKPSREFWDKCVQVSGIQSPETGIVIDDSKTVVKGAMDYGFRGVLIDKKGEYDKAAVAGEVDAYVASFDELNTYNEAVMKMAKKNFRQKSMCGYLGIMSRKEILKGLRDKHDRF
ncbi:hypothetical protein HYV82_01015 [Candidatus Woesearchaeota archaeon]|nr:hypothetical protein [Candidatus Woesearchaeota archaeon]